MYPFPGRVKQEIALTPILCQHSVENLKNACNSHSTCICLVGDFFTSTMENHHQTTIWQNIFFPSIEESQI